MPTTSAVRIAPPKRLIYGPGPSMVDPRAYEAMVQPITGLRDPWFLALIGEIRGQLKEVFGAPAGKVLLVPGSGSSAMEASIANFVKPGAKLGVFANGFFGDRLTAMGQCHHAHVVRLEKAWGEVFSESEAAEFLEREKPDVVAFVQAETSTGAYQSGRAIVPAARRIGALVIADCVTSLGAMPVEAEAVGIDVAYSCGQKGLSCPAGLSPVCLSPRALSALEQRTDEPDTWYLDLKMLSKYYEPPNAYHHTPSPPLFYAMRAALGSIEEEGLRNRWDRHQRAGTLLMNGLTKFGFSPVVALPEDRLWHVSVVRPPETVNEAQLRETLMAKYGMEIAGGLGQFAGKALRIGTMGPLANNEAVETLLEAIAASI